MAATTHVADAIRRDMRTALSGAEASRVVPPLVPWPRRILVASGGSASAAAALSVAQALARRAGSSVELLAVFTPHIPAPADVPTRCEAPDRLQAAQVLRRVRAQRDAVVRSGPAWPMRFESGDRAEVIARIAREKEADLVVVGIGRPDPADRGAGDLTPSVVARQVTAPIYAAMAGAAGAPRRVIVLFAFGRTHAATLRAAVECMQPGGELLIVRPGGDAVKASATSDLRAGPYAEEVALGSAAMLLEGIRVRSVELAGDTVDAVLALADRDGADLIAVPLHGAPGPVRELVPNRAAELLLRATCSVLVVPDPVAEGGAPC